MLIETILKFTTGIFWLDKIIIGLIILYLLSKPKMALHLALSFISIMFIYEVYFKLSEVKLSKEVALKIEIKNLKIKIKQNLPKISTFKKSEIDSLLKFSTLLEELIAKELDQDSLKLKMANLTDESLQIKTINQEFSGDYSKIKKYLKTVSNSLLSQEYSTGNLQALKSNLDTVNFTLNIYKQLNLPTEEENEDKKNDFIYTISNTIINYIFGIFGYFEIKSEFAQIIIILTFYYLPVFFSIYLYLDSRYFRQEDSIDNFKGDELFFKYGRQIFSQIVPIGLNDEQEKDIQEIKIKLIDELIENSINNYVDEENYSQTLLTVIDKEKKTDKREFIRIKITTQRKSSLYYFLYIKTVGKQILIHHYAYLQGRHYWYTLLSFLTWTPVTILFWLYRYITKRFDILSHLNTHFDRSSYDLIDTKSFFQAISFNFSTSTKKFAQTNDLLTEELSTAINNTIYNSQTVQIEKSAGSFIGSISFKK